MGFSTAISQAKNPADAARDLARSLDTKNAKLLVFFASPAFPSEALGKALAAEFAGIPSLGCTTSGELADGRMLKHSIVAGIFDDTLLDGAAVALVRDMASDESTAAALAELVQALGQPGQELDPQRHVGLVLHDGLSVREEQVMAALSARTNVPFVGGSAGDDLAFRETQVFVNFVPSHGASALAMVRPKVKFKVLKTQSFDVSDAKLVVTSADEATRTVHTFNGKPAAEEYARALGVSVEELPGRFQSNPVGLVAPGGEPFVRSPQQLKGGSVVFYCQIAQGAELSVLRARNLVEDTARDFQTAVAELGSLSAAINFHCILRTLELEQRGLTEAYGQIFAGKPAIGFSTYGESYIGHINQTSTMLLFA